MSKRPKSRDDHPTEFICFPGSGLARDPDLIMLARTAGFCQGVERAVQSAYELVESDPSPVMYGELIHNRAVVDDLLARGFELAHTPGEIEGLGREVLVRAHGITPEEHRELEERGHTIVDRTCPFVLHIYRIVREAAERGEAIYIAGDVEHPEIIGIVGVARVAGARSVHVLPDAEAFEKLSELDEPAILLAQTTYSKAEFLKIREIIAKQIANFKVFDTICFATENRQTEAKRLAEVSDLVLVVGGRHSSNTKRLYDLCRRVCGETYLIENADDLERLRSSVDFSHRHLGVTAGASTPDSIIMEVIRRMSETKQVQDEGEAMNQEMNETVQEVGEEMHEETVQSEAQAEETPETIDNEEKMEQVSDALSASKGDDEDIDFTEFIDNIPTLKRGQTVEGVIVRYDEESVYVDVRDKSEGKIPMREFIKDPDFDLEAAIAERKPIEVYVRNIRNTDHGKEILLSKARVDFAKYKDLLQKAYENEEVVTVKVFKIVREGVIATYGGIDIYIHRTQLEMHTVEDLEPYRGQTLDIMITQFDDSRRRLRVSGSRRSLLNKMRRKQAEAVWDNIEVGDIYEGIVRSLTDFGAFVDIGGVDGLVHISELSWDRIEHPRDVVSVGDKIQVYVKDFDRERDRISLGYKSAADDPYANIETRFPQGSIVTGKVVRMFNFGAFVEIAEGVDALCHISQISSRHLNHPSEVLKEGQMVDARVLDVNNETRRISISIKAVQPMDTPTNPEAAERHKKQQGEFPTSYQDDTGSGADIKIVGSDGEEFELSQEEPVEEIVEEIKPEEQEQATESSDEAKEEAEAETTEA